MIDFIICDNIKKHRENICEIVDNVMMTVDNEYRKHIFSDYDESFFECFNKKMNNKIYILDIDTPTSSGIDVARKIRMRDTNSILIFLTGHKQYGDVILKEDFLYLSFIDKCENGRKRLIKSLKRAISMVGLKKSFQFKDNRTTYKINYEDILYVTRDSVIRKTILKLDYAEYELTMPLSEFAKFLTDDFVKTHRACYINRQRVSAYSKTDRRVVFDNGEEIDLISTRFKGELV